MNEPRRRQPRTNDASTGRRTDVRTLSKSVSMRRGANTGHVQVLHVDLLRVPVHPNLHTSSYLFKAFTMDIKMNNKLHAQAIPRPCSTRLEEESKRASSRPFPWSNIGSLPRSIFMALKYNRYCTFLGKGCLTKLRDSRQIVVVLVRNAAETNNLVAFA